MVLDKIFLVKYNKNYNKYYLFHPCLKKIVENIVIVASVSFYVVIISLKHSPPADQLCVMHNLKL